MELDDPVGMEPAAGQHDGRRRPHRGDLRQQEALGIGLMGTHIDPGGAHRHRGGEAGQQMDAGHQGAVRLVHQPADLAEQVLAAVAGLDAHHLVMLDALPGVLALHAEAGHRVIHRLPLVEGEAAPVHLELGVDELLDAPIRAAESDHVDVVAAPERLAPVGRDEITPRDEQADGLPVGADLVAALLAASGKAPTGRRHTPRTVQ